MRMLLDALVGLEFLTKQHDRYALTPESAAFLVSTKPDYQGGMYRHVSRQLLPNWLGLADSVRTGKPAMAVNRETVGAAFFRDFVEDLFSRSYGAAQKLADHLRVADATAPFRVLDVAAGSAVWSIPLAEKSPQVEVTVVDWSEVIPVSQRVAERHGVRDHYRFVAGDLLETDFGSGYHAATLGNILHSEGEARSRQLLGKVYAALEPGGKIVIAEVLPNEERTGPPPALVFALNMLVHTEQGDVFSFEQIAGWLREAGFIDARRLDISAPSPLILASKPAK
jgi:ubiquinone/menaquinone biosynthesis C-methylase UbiE